MKTSFPAAVLLLVAAAHPAFSSPNPSETGSAHSSVRVEYSSQPATMILFVQVISPTAKDVKSLSVYGDSRAELARGPYGEPPVERREIHLAPEVVEQLLEKLVASGLADYDALTLRARRREENGGRQFSAPDGAATLVVQFQLEYAQVGDRLLGHVSPSIREYAVDLAAVKFPGISEYAALADLQGFLYNEFRRSGMPLQ